MIGETEFGKNNSDMWLMKVDTYGNKQWKHIYGGSNDDHAYCVIDTADGGYAIAGSTNSYGNGLTDM